MLFPFTDKLTNEVHVASDTLKSLRHEVQSWRQKGAILQPEMAKECVDAFIAITSSILPDNKAEECLLELLCALCEPDLRDEMRQYARKRFSTVSKREAKRIKLEQEGDSYEDSEQVCSTQNENIGHAENSSARGESLSQAARTILTSLEGGSGDIGSQQKATRVWQPSYRAKLVSKAVQDVASVRVVTREEPGKLSFQARLDQIQLKKHDDTATKAGGSLQCGICRENKIVPCIAQCGHVCCGPCWQSWIKKLEAASKPVTCPLCRQPANVDTIRRVKLM